MKRPVVNAMLAVFAAGCGVTDPAHCAACAASAVVSGSVVDRSGAPLSDAWVEARAFHATCGVGDALAGTGAQLPRTDASGRFDAMVEAAQPVVAGCTRLVITHADRPSLADTLDVPAALR